MMQDAHVQVGSEFPGKKKKTLFTSKLDLSLKKKKKLVKCFIWSVGRYGAEIWKLRKVDLKYLKSLKIWR
jgi:hypothetical protein